MKRRMIVGAAIGLAVMSAQSNEGSLEQRIVAILMQAPRFTAGHRPLHAKGVVCEGTFTASPQAASISRSAHLQGAAVPVTVRLSDSGADPTMPDTSPDAAPRGFAIRFRVPGGGVTDIVANSHNGFVVGTGQEFLDLQIAIRATDPAQPHPWPIEQFLAAHPRALRFVQDPKPTPVSYANESFFGNNAFRFVDNKNKVRTGRYQIVPVDGAKYLTDAEAKTKSADFLSEELTARIAKGPAKFRLVLQLAGEGDNTADSTAIWPDDRRRVELGIVTIQSIVPDSAAAERALAFDPARLTDGIELSDDPLPALRSRVYALSVAARRAHEAQESKSK